MKEQNVSPRTAPSSSLTSESLLPCPFCGSSDLTLDNLVDEDDYFVSCGGCQVQQIASYTREEAVRRWNRRAGQVTHQLVDYSELFRIAQRGESCAVVCCNRHYAAKEIGDATALLATSPKRFMSGFSIARDRILHRSGGKVYFVEKGCESLRGLTLAKVVRV